MAKKTKWTRTPHRHDARLGEIDSALADMYAAHGHAKAVEAGADPFKVISECPLCETLMVEAETLTREILTGRGIV